MSELFDRDKSVISRHISAIYNEGELDRNSTVAKNATVQIENGRSVIRQIDYYNLDVIISVGYRVKSIRGTRFRQWANRVLKEYLLRGYSINQRFERLERRVAETENKIDFFVHTSMPPVEGVFYDGKIFDAYKFASYYTNIVLHEHIVMPDHFHAIIQIDNNHNGGGASVGDGLKPSPTDTQPSESGMQPTKHGLTEFVRALKTFSARKINELRQTQGTPVWQRNYYEHIIRNDDEFCKTVNYINENPAKWNVDE